MGIKNLYKRGMMGLCGVAVYAMAALTMTVTLDISTVAAHGERSQEPFLRMRTVQWYDVKWGPEVTKVNENAQITGKFHLAEDWPRAAARPDFAFFNVGSPSSVYVRLSTKINGHPWFISGPLQIGRDYAFEVQLRARIPGRHHMHAMLNVKDAGPIAGPGAWMNVTGSWDDFTNPLKLLTGETIDSETFNLSNGIFWHILWMSIGIFWIGIFVARPMFLPRSRVLLAYGDDLLLDPMDKKITWVLAILTLAIVWGGYRYTETKHPYTVPIQAGQSKVAPLPVAPNPVAIKITDANYDVPGRALRVSMEVTNNGDTPVTFGEFTTAGIRFVNSTGRKYLDPQYPRELVAVGLNFDDDGAIQPGETKQLRMEAKDALWEIQRLMALLGDPESRFGGLLMSWDSEGNRHINSIAGPVIPVFTKL
ncbi:methane monooxygenase/ammonia monooxygenase subunit B [Nitrosomonas eutropha]|uniref:Ammonia monooxygenase subunit B n=2 Tax=Nitrosomonas eutropha TaxID=916 RepID=Q0ADP8_NITEC|nr:methane monooxygenase/ammonia monooxygenase subunit B [Nitrosomonas eutropha]ABI60299.1 ammonia monooxygenase subunit B [Nitrosomonas eutropha C91]ABI60534.1 ammonia monooxygenase subunit B [Nitrosomonas eutropha C91]PXV73000.1 ammonia monooxygenase subunit B [Nitrosomonas eutropha]SEJ33819.1 ammonia monooxygenase subunit B [Nitrosomonas eutropha]